MGVENKATGDSKVNDISDVIYEKDLKTVLR